MKRQATKQAIVSGDWINWQAWNDAGRPETLWGPHPKLSSTRAYLQHLKSARVRTSVRSAMRRRVGSHWGRMNRKLRESLHDAVFEVMDEIESQGGGRSEDPRVVQLRIAMNLLADDMGWQ